MNLAYVDQVKNIKNAAVLYKKKIKKPVTIDPKYIGKKMSRNEPCLCGSGKKYKKCCGAL